MILLPKGGVLAPGFGHSILFSQEDEAQWLWMRRLVLRAPLGERMCLSATFFVENLIWPADFSSCNRGLFKQDVDMAVVTQSCLSLDFVNPVFKEAVAKLGLRTYGFTSFIK